MLETGEHSNRRIDLTARRARMAGERQEAGIGAAQESLAVTVAVQFCKPDAPS